MSYGGLNSVIKKSVESRIPLYIHFDLTYNCNLNCIHCYVVKNTRSELGTFKIKKILQELASAGTLFLNLSGGEVLLREDFFEIAEYARELNFALRIFTNGTLIDESTADKIADLNPEMVCLSVYSTKPEIHGNITTDFTSLKKTIKAIQILKNRNLNVRINYTAMNQNINEYHQVYELSQKIGAIFQGDPLVMPKINGDPTPINYQINENEMYNLWSDTIFDISYENKFNIENPIKELEDLPCYAGSIFGYISPYGDIFPCVMYPLLCGNLNEKSFNEIWHHSPQMIEVSNLRMSELPICSKCKIRQYCRFCPGLAYMEGNLLSEPPKRNCQEAQVIKKLFGRVD